MQIKSSPTNERSIPAPTKHSSYFPFLCIMSRIVRGDLSSLGEFGENGVVLDIILVVGLDFSSDAVQ